MADEIKKINVRIGGISYQLISSENEIYTRSIAAKADEMIRRVMQSNPQLNLNMSIVLALVNSVDELAKVLQHLDSLDGNQKESEKQLFEMRKELMRLREQNWEMKKELLRVNALISEYETILAKFSTSEAISKETHSKTSAGQDIDSAEMTDEPDKAEDPESEIPSQPEETPAPEPDQANEPAPGDHPSEHLKQTNLEEYLRENGWPQPLDT